MNLRVMTVAMLAVFVGFALPLADAEAKRLGGGFSFGSKKSFQSPQKRSTVEQGKQAPGQAAGQAGATGTAGKAAGLGGMGMLGGLMAGGLLGALFFGGAFENINFMDVLIFGLIAFLLFKLLVRRRPTENYANAAGYQAPEANVSSDYQRNMHDANTPDQNSASQAGGVSRMLVNRLTRPGSKPKAFDEPEFLENAKTAFAMLQSAWDTGELAELRAYSTDAVFAELQDQFRATEGNNETEIMSLEAKLLNVNEADNTFEASVLFTAQLREIDKDSGLYPEPIQVEEIWHFMKPSHAAAPTWFLDGIQQVED